MTRHARQHQAGVTLVELILVIALIGIIGGVLTMQLAPAINSYLLVGQRAAMTNQADAALRRIVADVRSAVPNSLRLGSGECLELVPTKDGGRFRTAPHTGNNAVATAYLDDVDARSEFDVLSGFTNPPVQGDAIVIGNQNTADVYNGANVGIVDTVTLNAEGAAGTHRIRLAQGNVAPGSRELRLPGGYEGGRFLVVPQAQKSVSYLCTGAGVDPATGSGTGTLYRFTSASLQAAPSCQLPQQAAVLADRVAHCAFQYSAGQGSTQESGFVQLQLTLADKGESVPLIIGAHVDNLP